MGPSLEDDTAARSVTWEEAKREEFLVDASDEARFGRAGDVPRRADHFGKETK